MQSSKIANLSFSSYKHKIIRLVVHQTKINQIQKIKIKKFFITILRSISEVETFAYNMIL